MQFLVFTNILIESGFIKGTEKNNALSRLFLVIVNKVLIFISILTGPSTT